MKASASASSSSAPAPPVSQPTHVVTGQPVGPTSPGRGGTPIVAAFPTVAGDGNIPTATAFPCPDVAVANGTPIPGAMPGFSVPVAAAQPVYPSGVQHPVPHGFVATNIYFQGNLASAADGRPAPPGAPGGGRYRTVMVIGPATFLVSLLILLLFWPLFWIPFVCPCDEHIVYESPEGRLYAPNGRLVR